MNPENPLNHVEQTTFKSEKVSKWVDETLAEGKLEFNGNSYFFRELPQDPKSIITKLVQDYGFSTPGQDGEGYMFHATAIENIEGVLTYGILGVPENPTISTLLSDQVPNMARNRHSNYGFGLVVVAKAPWKDLEIQGTGWPEPIGVPSKKFAGDKSSLPNTIPRHLTGSGDLRCLPPEHILGFYVVPQERG